MAMNKSVLIVSSKIDIMKLQAIMEKDKYELAIRCFRYTEKSPKKWQVIRRYLWGNDYKFSDRVFTSIEAAKTFVKERKDAFFN